jgi:hypothetical protein
MKKTVFLGVTPCSAVYICQVVEEPVASIFRAGEEDGSCRFLVLGAHVPFYTASHPKKL